MCIKSTPEAHRVPVNMSDRDINVIEAIRQKRPEYPSRKAVIIAAIYRMAEAEGVSTV